MTVVSNNKVKEKRVLVNKTRVLSQQMESEELLVAGNERDRML